MKQGVLTAGVFAALIALFAFVAIDRGAPDQATARTERGGTFSSRDRDPQPGECPNTLVKVTLGPDVAGRVGVEFHTVAATTIAESLRANAESRYTPDKYARVAPRVAGVVREPKVVLGQTVAAGAVLATVESSEFGQIKAELLQARAILALRRQTYDREWPLFEKKITSGREALEAQTALEEARIAEKTAQQRLAALGVSPEAATDPSPVMDVVAPFDGVVVDATAVPGELAGPDKPIFAVANLDRMWISIDVYEIDIARIAPDQRVTFTVEGLPGQRFPGRIVAIGGEVDERTRTVRVFGDIKNVGGLLKAHMFGRAEIAVKPPEPKLLVPKSAVQNDGDCNLVFVSPVRDVFQARKIEIGAVYENGYEVVGGLAAGEKVVTTGSFLLKTEVLRGQIGAG